MLDTARGRLVVLGVLLAGHVVLFPMYAQQPVNPAAGVFPGEDTFIDAPDEYLGERVTTGGFVQRTAPLTIAVDTQDGTHELVVTDADVSPARGDKVRVFGVLTGPRTIRSLHAFIVPRRGLWYTWSVSFLAGLWVLARFLRQWRVDLRRVRVQRRDPPVAVSTVVRAVWSRGDQSDA